MVRLTFNGKRMTSPGQLSRELEKSVLNAVDRHIRSSVPAGVRLKKTARGYEAEGSPEALDRMIRRLGR